MTGAPKISVVLIVLNGERFLREALDSVVAQTLEEWELIAVDDGSVDGTPTILREYAAALSGRMHVLRHPSGANRGMSASRNLGIRGSRGEYVTFLDHDDVLLPEKLEAHSGILDRHPDAASVIGPNVRWHSWADPSLGDEIQDLGLPAGAVAPPPGPLPVFLARSVATPIGITVRRKSIEEVGGFDESFAGMYEDQAFQAKLYLHYPVYVADAVWHRYRQHGDSCVAQTFRAGAQMLARRRFLRWLRDYVQRVGTDRPELASLLRTELAKTRYARPYWLMWQVRRGVVGVASCCRRLRTSPRKDRCRTGPEDHRS
jgi:glycosyltransferase involved in cell wall biosynthesis